MTTTMTTQRSSKEMDEPGGSTAFRIDQTLEAVDSRSSSLSDLDDAQDEHAMTSPDIIATKLEADLENDSEAETERLDQITPKPRRGTLSDGMFTAEKTSSALSRQVEIDSDIGEEATPSRHVRQEDFEGVLDDDEDATEGLGEAPSPRKRKRSSSEGSPLSDAMDIDEPARKRAHPAEDDEDEEVIEDDEDNEVLADEEGEPAADGSLDDEQEDDTELADGDLVQDEPMEGASLDETQPARPVKGKKGKRKGKKMKGTDIGMEYAIGEGSGLPDAAVEAVADQEAEGEAEEEDPAAVDEELSKKKNAMDGLAQIEKLFFMFRQKHVANELAEIDRQYNLLRERDSKHPDYLTQRACVDVRRDEKIRYEDTLRQFKLDTARRKLVAERAQIGTQYVQSVRDLRDRMLEEANKIVYAMQRDRRRWGADDRNHLRLYNPDRRQQVKDQTKYNLEVSILSGVAKYVGFPAAPEIKAIAREDAEEDLEKMGINPRPPQVVPTRQTSAVFEPTTSATHTNPERTAAAEQFYEQTPWANPQHPAHAQHAHAAFYNPSRQSSATYATPAAQIRVADRVNGSGSTIEALSGPPSSALAPGSQAVSEPQHVQLIEETLVPPFRRMGSGASSVPPVGSKRDFSAAESLHSVTPGPTKLVPGLPTDASAVNQAFPTSALHVGDAREVYDTPRLGADVGDDRSVGILGQRAGPFAVGVGGGGRFGS